MIVNGKEVNINYRTAQFVQQKIDNQPEIPETAKVEVSKKDLKDLDQIYSDGYGAGAFNEANLYGDMYGSENILMTGVNSAENRYEYYTTFDQMDSCPFVHRGLQVIADDACQKNTEGDTVKIYSDDEEIKEILEDLFHERLNLNKELWSIIFETIKLGDNFYEVIPDDYEHPTEVARIRYLDPRKVNRIEKNGKLAFYTYRTELDANENYFTGSDNKNKQDIVYKLQPWQIIHFKITDKKFTPYGGSLLYPGVQTYRRYSMLEDAMLVYRLVRVPERRVFKIDIGNLSTSEGYRAVQKIKDNNRAKSIMDEKGNIQTNSAALSMLDDIYIPVREGQSGTEVSTLQPGVGLNNIDDIRHFRDELLWTLNIPPEYLGFTSDQGGMGGQKGSLAMQDIKFARFVERVQYYIEEGLTKIAAIELFFKKKKRGDLKNFRLELTPPSNVKEVMDIEYLNQKMGLISTMIGTQLFPKDFILKYVMKMSKKEIADINLQKEIEAGQMQNNAMGGGLDMAGGLGAMGGGLDMTGGMNATAPMMSVKTEELTPKTMVNLFGKDVLIEHKEDYSKLMKALEEYNKQKEQNLIKEEVDESLSNNEFLNKVKELLINDEQSADKTNKTSAALYYENELGGLNYSKEEMKIWGKPKKKSGPRRGNTPKLISEEITVKLGK